MTYDGCTWPYHHYPTCIGKLLPATQREERKRILVIMAVLAELEGGGGKSELDLQQRSHECA
jgi:hypothetical protein